MRPIFNFTLTSSFTVGEVTVNANQETSAGSLNITPMQLYHELKQAVAQGATLTGTSVDGEAFTSATLSAAELDQMLAATSDFYRTTGIKDIINYVDRSAGAAGVFTDLAASQYGDLNASAWSSLASGDYTVTGAGSEFRNLPSEISLEPAEQYVLTVELVNETGDYHLKAEFKDGSVAVNNGRSFSRVGSDFPSSVVSGYSVVALVSDFSSDSGANGGLKEWDYFIGGALSSTAVANLNTAFASVAGKYVDSSDSLELVGIKITAASGSAVEATSVSVRVATSTRNTNTEHAYGLGTEATTRTLLTTSGAETAQYNKADSITFTPVPLTQDRLVFVEIDPQGWSLTDVTITLLVQEV